MAPVASHALLGLAAAALLAAPLRVASRVVPDGADRWLSAAVLAATAACAQTLALGLTGQGSSRRTGDLRRSRHADHSRTG